jgi:hypothetical protein
MGVHSHPSQATTSRYLHIDCVLVIQGIPAAPNHLVHARLYSAIRMPATPPTPGSQSTRSRRCQVAALSGSCCAGQAVR